MDTRAPVKTERTVLAFIVADDHPELQTIETSKSIDHGIAFVLKINWLTNAETFAFVIGFWANL